MRILMLWLVASSPSLPRDPAPPLEIPTESLAARAGRDLNRLASEALQTKGAPRSEHLVSGLAAVMERRARSTASPLDERVRAVELLAASSAPTAEAQLRGLLSERTLPPALRGQVAVGLAARAGGSALTAVAPLLSEEAPSVRIGAARALRVIATADAKAALEAQLASEADREVREALQRAWLGAQP